MREQVGIRLDILKSSFQSASRSNQKWRHDSGYPLLAGYLRAIRISAMSDGTKEEATSGKAVAAAVSENDDSAICCAACNKSGDGTLVLLLVYFRDDIEAVGTEELSQLKPMEE